MKTESHNQSMPHSSVVVFSNKSNVLFSESNHAFRLAACRFARLIVVGLMLFVVVHAVSAQQQPFDIDLWSSGLPNSNGIDKTQPFNDRTGNFKPSMRVYLPDKNLATGRAVVALPGGGYSGLAMDHEGYEWAPFFNQQGIALIVLKYRMPKGNPDVPFVDACEAIRLVKDSAANWLINPHDVGIMGSSAGGHLATTVATHAVQALRPAFQILFYPVVTMDQTLTHGGSRGNLIGNNPTAEQVRFYSNELRVDDETPPAYITLSDDDNVVPAMNAINYYAALQRRKISASLHIYPSGGHGWGVNKPAFIYHQQQQTELKSWLQSLKAPKADAIRVACIGNSITFGDGIRNRKTDSYPAQLGNLLGENYVVKNFGVSGATLLTKADAPYVKTQAWKDAQAFLPTVVVLKLGTNDSKPRNWILKKAYSSDLQSMIDTLQQLPSNPRILLCYPAKAFSNRFSISDSIIDTDIIPIIQKVAKKNKLQVVDLYAVTKDHPELFDDEIHPNKEGATLLARTVKEALLLKK